VVKSWALVKKGEIIEAKIPWKANLAKHQQYSAFPILEADRNGCSNHLMGAPNLVRMRIIHVTASEE